MARALGSGIAWREWGDVAAFALGGGGGGGGCEFAL